MERSRSRDTPEGFDPRVLADNLVGVGRKKPAKPERLAKGWDLEDCSTTKFPWQAHHLVPEKQLPKHQVTFYLAKNSGFEDDEYVLQYDTDYDTNHGFNGRFMPFVSTTHQWQSTTSSNKKKQICFRMMKLTQRQLHQGPHAYKDYSEDPDTETSGYKQAVDDLLEIVYWGAIDHLDFCKICKSDAPGGKKWIQPLESTVRHVYRAADILEDLIVADKVWVSKRAHVFFTEQGY